MIESIESLNIDELNKLSGYERTITLEKYHEWKKQQLDIERKKIYREKYNAYNSLWRIKNPERYSELHKRGDARYRLKHLNDPKYKQQIHKATKKYYVKNREKILFNYWIKKNNIEIWRDE